MVWFLRCAANCEIQNSCRFFAPYNNLLKYKRQKRRVPFACLPATSWAHNSAAHVYHFSAHMRMPPEFLYRARSLIHHIHTCINIFMYILLVNISCSKREDGKKELQTARTNVMANIYRIDANVVKYFRVDGYVCRMQLLIPLHTHPCRGPQSFSCS